MEDSLPCSETLPKFLVAQLGARMHYAVPRILHAAGMLERLYTDVVAPDGVLVGVLLRSVPSNSVRRLLGRRPQGIPRCKIVHFPLLAVQCCLRQRATRSGTELTAAFLRAGTQFCRRITALGLGSAGAVYAFNSAGLELLRFAKERGLATVLEQTLPPWILVARLADEEREAWPGWEPEQARDALADEFTAREQQEWHSADVIVTGSQFVVQGIQQIGGPAERCRVVPYGTNVVGPHPVVRCRRQGALRVLFCGALNLRKGIPYLLEAARRLPGNRFHFRLAGPLPLTQRARAELSKRAELLGAVPRPDMFAHYQWADVFVLPTVCEGSATACYEALAAGLPVITTPNAGSVVRHGLDGFIVPIRDAEAIAGKLDLLLSQPDLLAQMSRNALSRASEFTLEKYGERLLAALANP